MVAPAQYTAPGTPRPGSESTCPQARLGIPSQSDGLNPHLLRLPPEEHEMAPHQGHPSGASAPVSRSCWSPSSRIPRTPRTPRWSLLLSRHRCPDHVHLPPTRCYICTNTKQATNKDISVYTSKHVH
jgi:hypothetical protein